MKEPSAVTLDLASLPKHLESLASNNDPTLDANDFLGQLGQLAAQMTNADCCVVQRFSDHNQVTATLVNGSEEHFDAAGSARVTQLALAALANQRTELSRLELPTLIATPIGVIEGETAVVTIALQLGQAAVEPFVLSLQLAASYGRLWQTQRESGSCTNKAADHLWLSELQHLIFASDNQRQLAEHIVDLIAIHTGAYQTAIGFVRSETDQRISVAAIGGSGDPIAESKWQNVFAETLLRREVTRWPDQEENKAATLAHRGLAEQISDRPRQSDCVVGSIPVFDDHGVLQAVISCVGSDREMFQREQLSQIGDLVGKSLSLWRANHQSGFSKFWGNLGSLLNAHRTFALASAVLIAIGFLPVHYRVPASATLIPQNRGFIVAPHAGTLSNTHARIGDLVRYDSLIATMDDRELQIQLAALRADQDRALKQRDVHRARDQVADQQLAELELARIDQEIELVQHRQNNLAVTSPIEGVIIAGELDGVQGAPVTTGQLIAEVANLDKLWLEIAIPEDELAEIAEGMTVQVAFDAFGSESMTATIDSIQSSAKIRGGQNVFIARASIDNEGGILRPGASGVAKVIGEKRPLWNVVLKRCLQQASKFWM